MIARTEQEIKDKIEEISYISDISDDLRIQYEQSRGLMIEVVVVLGEDRRLWATSVGRTFT